MKNSLREMIDNGTLAGRQHIRSITSYGTSEGVSKSWETRRGGAPAQQVDIPRPPASQLGKELADIHSPNRQESPFEQGTRVQRERQGLQPEARLNEGFKRAAALRQSGDVKNARIAEALLNKARGAHKMGDHTSGRNYYNKAKAILGYGTSEGVEKSWITRHGGGGANWQSTTNDVPQSNVGWTRRSDGIIERTDITKPLPGEGERANERSIPHTSAVQPVQKTAGTDNPVPAVGSVTEDHVRRAFGAIVKNQNAPALNYAVNYAKHGLGTSGHEMYVQALYTLNNLSSWRGDQAKQVRQTLKNYVKQYAKQNPRS